jgi:hypothetical protein
MKITTIEKGDLHGPALQFLRRIQSGESTTQNQNTMPRWHANRSFRSNPTLTRIISFSVTVSHLIRWKRTLLLGFRGATFAFVCLFPVLCACADSPEAKSTGSASVSAESEPVRAASAPTIVVGFLGGFVRHDDAVHSTVQVAQSLRKAYPSAVHIETFENRRRSDAYNLILHLLGADREARLTNEQKRAARIILYGHSWGASAVVALARDLQAKGIPVILTVQVDSVAKSGQNDSLIPENVRYAANFYQDKGLIRGQQKIMAADASGTQILGNFHMDYTANPISCPQYPWYTRVLMRSHIEIECDQHVWQRVENLIREQLPISVAASTNSQ